MAWEIYLSTGGKCRHPVSTMQKIVVMVWQIPQAIKSGSLVGVETRVVAEGM